MMNNIFNDLINKFVDEINKYENISEVLKKV